jgi:hypothetical protein
LTHSSVEANQRLVKIGQVDSKFCPNTFSDEGQIGLHDEAISKAQKKTGADWIMKASFWHERSGCISVTGTGVRVYSKK